ncbi:hypothetical protein EYR41_004532 [Orbilia oligospora]|uniref:Uncharacterized protein n=1 Tax=Orbilia oligospora TaxID=2813651 RepID=A0A7C8PIJ0_ORBOL|nr:hypothetical protein TWF751_005338 [Orbilia oligospora]TGJ72655.1 hypothetical protein EYR41_004532 [Orbilia oligospora]
MEEPQPSTGVTENGATSPMPPVPVPAPEEIAPQNIEAIEADGQTRTENGLSEVMDLTGDSDTLPTAATSDVPEPQPVEERPLEVEETKDVAKEPSKASAETGKETKKRPYPDDGSSDSDDDSDMMDDSGITLNLQDDTKDEELEELEDLEDLEDEDEDEDENNEEPEVITIDESSDEESVVKGRSKKQNVPEPFNDPAVERPDPTKSNGAIAVSAGLKLGKSARSAIGVAKITRRPLIESINAGQIQVVDYSVPGLPQGASASAQALKGISPTLPSKQTSGNGEIEVISLLSDPVDPTDELPNTNTEGPTHPVVRDGADDHSDDNNESASDSDDVDDEEEDGDNDEEEDGAVSDCDSVESVDTDIWSHQQKYYVRQQIPPLLHEDYRKLFTPDISGAAAAQKALVDIESQETPKKRKICDVCMEPHLTEQCDKLKCNVCEASHEHFSFNCPYKSSTNKKASDLPIFNVPAGQKDFEIWRIMPPQSRKPVIKASKIPMACYECGDDDHFGDDCPTFGKRRSNVPTTSIWNAKSASKWTTMNMDSKYIRNGKAKADTNDDDSELGWFEARLQAAKVAIPDSNIKRDYLEQHRYGAPPRTSGNTRPHIQMNLPRNLPGQDSRDDRGGPSFTRYQRSQSGVDKLPARPGGDHFHRNDHYRRDRSRSPRRSSFSDRVGGYAQDRGNYRDRPQDFPRGQGHQPPHRGNQGYHAVPPPPPAQSQNYYGQQPGWSLPGSIQLSVQSSNQPPLPPGPPPPPLDQPPPPPPPPHRRNSGRGGRGRGFFRGKRGGKH